MKTEGYIYLIRNTAPGYAAYKVGHTQARIHDERILTHLSLGWELVGLWLFDEIKDAISAEKAVLADWSNTLQVPQGLTYSQMKIQGGHSETAKIQDLVNAIRTAQKTSNLLCDSIHSDKIAVDRVDDVIRKHIETLYPNTIKIKRNFIGGGPRPNLNNSKIETRHRKLSGTVILRANDSFVEDASSYIIGIYDSRKSCECRVPRPIGLDDASPKIPAYTSLSQQLFPKGSSERANLYSDAIEALIRLYRANKPETKLGKNGNPIPDQFRGLIDDSQGYDTKAIVKQIRASERGKIRYASLTNKTLKRCVSAVLGDRDLQSPNIIIKPNVVVVKGVRSNKQQYRTTYWECVNWISAGY
jgi:hypothetical protein